MHDKAQLTDNPSGILWRAVTVRGLCIMFAEYLLNYVRVDDSNQEEIIEIRI